MKAFLFLVYIALGAGAGWAAFTYGGYELQFAGIGGALITLALGQAHLFISGGRDESIDTQLADVGAAQDSSSRRIDVLEARTDAVETTVKHELTERRDALVSEMKQLEGLIERLSDSFEARLTGASETGINAIPGNGAMAVGRPVPVDAALRDVKSALDDARVDLHLQPIVSLPQRRVSFYEGLTRLRREDGSLILPAEFLDAARRARLLGIIDTLTLFRCVEIVRRLHRKDRRVGVFCNISGTSLDDDQFFPFFLDFISQHRDLSGAVIFEMRADRFEQRSRQMRENMDKLAALGFRFSLDHASTLALDLPRLQDAGVRFVKFDGGQLIDQLRDPKGPRPTSSILAQISGEDVSAVFSRYGVTMIAEKLEDEAGVVEILEYGIPYGQGHVFGSPRPIKASLMEETAPPSDFRRRISTFG
ncbi:MAG: EAL domain-containing protein [Pseudomonadota bacterium]